ncbi:MAG: GYD domain-containing protein [Alsobacter sp.]
MRVMYLATYAPHALQGLMQGADREAVMRSTFEHAGGKLTGLAFTRGAYDVVVSGEVPDQAASMGLAMAVRASGSIADLCVLEELELPEVVKAANAIARGYRPAG